MPILHLIGVRIQATIRSDNTVAIEIIIACRITTIVATIGIYVLTCYRTLIAQTLVNEVPNVATLIFRILAYKIPILLEATF